MICPPDLKNLYREGRLIPFIGAGASMAVQWDDHGTSRRGPSWAEFVNEAAKIIGYDDPELLRVRGNDLQILEYFRDQPEGGFPRLTKWLNREMNPSDEALLSSLIHEELAALDKCNLFYTTNYDDFIERSFNLRKRLCRVIAKEADMAGLTNGTEIVKFHGDTNHPEAMVLSESDYQRRLKFETAMDYRLRADVLGRALLFIGYSFSDWNISYLFRLVNEQFGDMPNSLSGKRAYIIVSDPSDFERQLFKSRKIEVIAADGAKRTEEIASLLKELRQ